MSDRSTILLEHHLKELKLPSFLREYGKMATRCAAEGADHPEYLFRLAELELIERLQRMVERRVRAARFPAVKTLDTFDFPSIPSVNKTLVMQLARCEYIERKENVIATGNSATGRSAARRPETARQGLKTGGPQRHEQHCPQGEGSRHHGRQRKGLGLNPPDRDVEDADHRREHGPEGQHPQPSQAHTCRPTITLHASPPADHFPVIPTGRL